MKKFRTYKQDFPHKKFSQIDIYRRIIVQLTLQRAKLIRIIYNSCFYLRRNTYKLLMLNVIKLCNKNQQNAIFLHSCFNSIIVSSTCFAHPSVHPQEDLYVQFYGIYIRSLVDGSILHERNTIKLHVQVFPRLNTWMFETCRRQYKKLN